jgi:hypothetical protein
LPHKRILNEFLTGFRLNLTGANAMPKHLSKLEATMPDRLDINKLTFGSDDAELDEKHGFLDKVFLKTSIYNRAKEGKRELVIGRKGAGKSAICLMLKKVFENEGATTILVTPMALSPQKLDQLKVSSINKDETYILAWRYVLLTMIGAKVLERVAGSKPLKRKKTFQKHLSNIRAFLVENNEIEKSVLERVVRAASIFSRLFSKLSVKGFGVEGSIETRQLQDQKDKSAELDRFSATLNSVTSELDGIRMEVLIDKVDEVWNQTEESALMIIGLIKAVHDLNASFKQAHTILFLRSDIYDTLKFNDADKFRSLEERLDWKETDLKHLIATRGRVSAGLSATEPNILWSLIFEKRVNGESAFRYMVKRTMRRPRELIQFCNNALADAQDNNQELISSSSILNAETQYSNWKLKDLASEYLVQYQYLEELLGLFQGFKAVFNRAQFESRYQETTAKLAGKYPNLAGISTDKMLQILFVIGFLGARRQNEDVFVFDDPTILLAKHTTISVHPAFHSALGLRDGRVVVSGSGNIVNVGGDIVGRHVIIDYADPELVSDRELRHLSALRGRLKDEKRELEEMLNRYGEDAPVRLRRALDDINERLREVDDNISRLRAYVANRP